VKIKNLLILLVSLTTCALQAMLQEPAHLLNLYDNYNYPLDIASTQIEVCWFNERALQRKIVKVPVTNDPQTLVAIKKSIYSTLIGASDTSNDGQLLLCKDIAVTTGEQSDPREAINTAITCNLADIIKQAYAHPLDQPPLKYHLVFQGGTQFVAHIKELAYGLLPKDPADFESLAATSWGQENLLVLAQMVKKIDENNPYQGPRLKNYQQASRSALVNECLSIMHPVRAHFQEPFNPATYHAVLLHVNYWRLVKQTALPVCLSAVLGALILSTMRYYYLQRTTSPSDTDECLTTT